MTDHRPAEFLSSAASLAPTKARSRPRILLSAFACDPKTGSEPYVGWNWAVMLAKDYEVHVLTRRYSQPLIADHSLESEIHFHYFDLPFAHRLDHHAKPIKSYYCLWQMLALPVVLAFDRTWRFDIIQHVTYNNVDLPGFLWLCRGPQFVWGPVGGGQVAPASLRVVYGRRQWQQRLRDVLKATVRYNPIVLGALRKASLVWFANEETATRLRGLVRCERPLLETAISDAGRAMSAAHEGQDGIIRVLWLSHVFPRKALELAIDGFIHALTACHGKQRLELVVVGDGPALPAARRQVEEAGVGGYIRLLGAVPHEAVQAQMHQADMFLFTSVQDTSGNVLLEAMLNALPVVALAHQGAKAIVGPGCGRLVPIGSYAETAAAVGVAIAELACAGKARADSGAAARRHVLAHHTWAAKRLEVLAVYEKMLTEHRADASE